jgi:hypothetical protein
MKCVGASRIDYDRFTIISAISVQAAAPAAQSNLKLRRRAAHGEKALRGLSHRAGNE